MQIPSRNPKDWVKDSQKGAMTVAEAGKRGGQSTSPAKEAASRENGKQSEGPKEAKK